MISEFFNGNLTMIYHDGGIKFMNITIQDAKLEAIKIIMRCLIMEIASHKTDKSNEEMRKYVSNFHEFCSSQVHKLSVANASNAENEIMRSKVDVEVDFILSGLGVSK